MFKRKVCSSRKRKSMSVGGLEKQHMELTLHVKQLEATIISLQQQ